MKKIFALLFALLALTALLTGCRGGNTPARKQRSSDT